MADDDELKALSHYPAGIPNPATLGFIPISMIGRPLTPAFPELPAVAERLGRAVRETDDDGFERELLAAAIHPDGVYYAWVESRCKVNGTFVDIDFQICTAGPAGEEYRRSIETYNPYFGCDVQHFAWHGDRLIAIYREKHRTYAFRLSLGAELDDDGWDDGDWDEEDDYDLSAWEEDGSFIGITDEWALLADHLVYVPYKLDWVGVLPLGEVARPRELSVEEARAEGLLPPGFDELVESRKQ
ncbi:MAG: hypothetical protein KC636_24165 [Myxococcales bacterium]|nr:hypothetical protein [Myxococcales bacterium]